MMLYLISPVKLIIKELVVKMTGSARLAPLRKSDSNLFSLNGEEILPLKPESHYTLSPGEAMKPPPH